MGSICTQTDFVCGTDFKGYNVQVFLCLVKDNEASTQCSLNLTPNEQELFERRKRKIDISIQDILTPTTIPKDVVRNLQEPCLISMNVNKTDHNSIQNEVIPASLSNNFIKNVVKNVHEDVFLNNAKELKYEKFNDNIEDQYLQINTLNKKDDYNQDIFCELEVTCDHVNKEKLYLSRKITKPIHSEEIGKIDTEFISPESISLDNILKINEHSNELKLHHTNVSQYKKAKCTISLKTKKCVTTIYKNKYKKNYVKKTRRRQVGPYKCKKCDIQFDLFSPFSRHLSSHEITEGKCCKICNKILSSEINLKRHMLIHTGKPFICEVCGRGFTGHYMLRDHLLNQHNQPTKKEELQTYFQCSACKSFLASSGALAYHQAREHTCDHCKEKWPCRASLRNHVMADHDNIQKNYNGQIVCRFCDETFLYRHSYINHMVKHNDEKLYECGICDKKISNKTSLQFHIKQVHEKHNYRYSCSHCKKKFICNAKLVEHERIHTGEKPFSCSLCNMSFAAKATYNNHVKLVHRVTPKLKPPEKVKKSVLACNYECPLCNEQSLSIMELEAHCVDIHNASIEFLNEGNKEIIKV
ncbi:unnamed protein product [Meganyctiphanes norvegica]|uniref:C2H2-type domain-containing protein n=1 Tax=Meganyctiphanes norvegica TaxID=48144 RepID=A0AAV2PWS9_MEGNR